MSVVHICMIISLFLVLLGRPYLSVEFVGRSSDDSSVRVDTEQVCAVV